MDKTAYKRISEQPAMWDLILTYTIGWGFVAFIALWIILEIVAFCLLPLSFHFHVD